MDDGFAVGCGVAAGAALALLLAGCGGPMTRGELQRGVETLGATAAEGRLVALGVAQDRTKVTFVRAHARELAKDAEHEAEKLNDAQASGDLARVKAQAVRLAESIDSALGDLQVAPADRRTGGDVARRLGRLTGQAGRLAQGL